MRGQRIRRSIAAAAGATLVAATSPIPAQEEARLGKRHRSGSSPPAIRCASIRSGSPELSPDGEWVAYTRRARDMDADDLAAVTHLWRVRVDGTGNRQLTRGPQNATAPAWSPDGTIIAFLAARGEEADAKTQVHFLYADGGEAWQVTGARRVGASSFSFAPDGSALLFTARDPLPEEEEEAPPRRRATPRWSTRCTG